MHETVTLHDTSSITCIIYVMTFCGTEQGVTSSERIYYVGIGKRRRSINGEWYNMIVTSVDKLG